MKIKRIAELTSELFKLDIKNKCRDEDHVHARAAFYKAGLKEYHTATKLGAYAGRDHVSVVNANKKWETYLQRPGFVDMFDELLYYIALEKSKKKTAKTYRQVIVSQKIQIDHLEKVVENFKKEKITDRHDLVDKLDRLIEEKPEIEEKLRAFYNINKNSVFYPVY